jgi:exodeoxyribonuclease-3
LRVKILSWNVNGVRAVIKKGFLDWLKKESPDILCLQEVKALPTQVDPAVLRHPEYQVGWNAALRLGYSGVATFSKTKPAAEKKGFGIARFDDEGRVLETDFGKFTLLNIYFPNGKMNAERLQYKMDFYDAALNYFTKLKKAGKKLVICGDYNTAHKPIDLARPADNEDISGFLPMERAWIDKLIQSGFIDTFRMFHEEGEQYSWWDMRTRARERNIGWRIDYHFISDNLKGAAKDAFILPNVTGSDHCPVGLELEI